MKKILLVVLLCFAVAQGLAAAPVGFGLRAGATLADQSYNLSSPSVNNPILGFAGGAFADVEIAKPLCLQVEALYIMKGWQNVANDFDIYDGLGYLGTTTLTFTYHFNYLEIPLLVKTGFSLSPLAKLNLVAGAYMALLVNETTDFSQAANGDLPARTASSDDTKYFPGTDFGLVFGAGVEFQHFLLDIRYDLGLSSVHTVGYGSTTPTNQVFSVLLGYRIL